MTTVYDKGNGEIISLRLDEKLLQAVKDQARINDRSVSAEIRQALRLWVEKAAA